MKLRPFLILFPAVAIFLNILHERAIACSCQFVGGGPPCSDYWKSAAIFTGKVVAISTILVEIEPGNPKWRIQERLVRFSIEKTFKGHARKEVELITGMTTASCGYQFKEGESYLVYATPYAKSRNRLFTSICHRTKLLSQADEDLSYLQALPLPGSGGTLYGRLTMPNPDKIKITIEGQGKRIETRANKDGNYRVSGLAPGEYKVTADLPKEIPHSLNYTIQVADRACHQLNL
jgi:hypothetical protein